MSIEREDGLLGRVSGNIQVGDLSRNYVGDNQPQPINRPMDEGTYDEGSPEQALISKERWAIVRQVTLSNPETAPFLDWAIDHFSGYSFLEIGQRHGVSKNVAQYRVNTVVEYLKKRIKGHQF